jgi:hypothetical protein
MMESADFLQWWPVVLVVVQGFLAWGQWSLVRRFVTRDDWERWRGTHRTDHDEIDKRLSDGRAWFTRIETDLRHLPTRDDLDQLKSQLAAVDKSVVRLDGSIRVVAAKLGAVQAPVDLLVEQAMEGR